MRDESAATTVTARTDLTALAAALVTVTLWGSAFVAIRDAGETLSPGSLALGRLLVALVVLGVAASTWREPLPGRRDLLGIAAFGVLFLGVYSVTLNAAERRVDAGTAAMLINTGPILIAILAGIFLKEGFPRWLFAGCAVAFSGCVLIGLANAQSDSRAGLGIALLIVAAFAYATAVVIQKPVLARASPLQVTWLGCAAATVVCLPFAPTLVGELDDAGATAISWMVYLGLAPTALGFATWAYALRRMSAGRLASLAYLIPVVAILLGWALLGETPPWLAAVGGALCLAGVAVARRRSAPLRAARGSSEQSSSITSEIPKERLPSQRKHRRDHRVMPGADAIPTVTIRAARAADRPALEQLAELDGRKFLDGPSLIVQLDGRSVACLSLRDGSAIADPFYPTDGLLSLLRVQGRPARLATATQSAAIPLSHVRHSRPVPECWRHQPPEGATESVRNGTRGIYKARRGWTFPWYSSRDSDFNYDFHVTLDEAIAPIEYNYRTKAEHKQPGTAYYVEGEQLIEQPCYSCFPREDEPIFHTYSTFGRGAEMVGGVNYFLDITALGRQEEWEEPKGRASSEHGARPNFAG